MNRGPMERSVCGRIAERVARSVGSTRFDRYFQRCARLRLNGADLDVAVPSTFYAGWLDARFGANLLEAARSETGNQEVSLKWTVDPSAFEGDGEKGPGVQAEAPIGARRTGLRCAPLARPASDSRWAVGSKARSGALRHSLDDFVVGEPNRMAFEAASRLANAGAEPGFSRLFLHGECGVGKTHLLQGLASAYLAARPRARVRYLSAEAFTNEYIAAVRSGRADGFRAGLRRLDLLCIDDVHFLGGKAATQAEFVHTFDALDLTGARVALASDQHPREIGALNQRLTSRCMAGMVVRVDRPDAPTRSAIVRRLAHRRAIALEPGAAELIAGAAGPSVRDLEGALARVAAAAQLLGGEAGGLIGASSIRRALSGEDASAPAGPPVRVSLIIDEVCSALEVPRAEVLGSGRHKRLVLARGLVAHLARELTSHSFPEIARALGRDHHSTVVTADQRFRRLLDQAATVQEHPGRAESPLSELRDRVAARVRKAQRSEARAARP